MINSLAELVQHLKETENARDQLFCGIPKTRKLDEKGRVSISPEHIRTIKRIDEIYQNQPHSVVLAYSPDLISVFPLYYHDLILRENLTIEKLIQGTTPINQQTIFATDCKTIDSQNRIRLPQKFCKNKKEVTIYGAGLHINIF